MTAGEAFEHLRALLGYAAAAAGLLWLLSEQIRYQLRQRREGERLVEELGFQRQAGRYVGALDGRAVELAVGASFVASVPIAALPPRFVLARDGGPGDPFRLEERAAPASEAELPLYAEAVREVLARPGRSIRGGALREARTTAPTPEDLRALVAAARAVEDAAGAPLPSLDPDRWVRARALVHEHARGRPVEAEEDAPAVVRLALGWLRADARLLFAAHRDLPPATRKTVVTLARLAPGTWTGERVSALVRALGDQPELRAAEWVALAKQALSGDDAVKDAVLSAMIADGAERHAATGLRIALSATGAGAEHHVLSWNRLAKDPNPGLAWLAEHGTVAAVPYLTEFADAWGGNAHAARARDAIQARAGVEHGAVSIAELASGELSIAEAPERGGLAAAPQGARRARHPER